jgi:mannobiose 2-epimerase
MAHSGFDFLVSRMWDIDEGGFHFSVAREGTPLVRRKNTDTHAYVLIALAVYHRVSGNSTALEYAEALFDILQERARDKEHGGYIEDFDGGNWPALNGEQMHIGAAGSNQASGGQQSSVGQIKTVDMHTNVLEAFLYLYETTGDPRHAAALREVSQLILERGIEPNHGCTITAFTPDWQPVADGEGRMTTSFGLNVELAWLLLETDRALGTSAAGPGAPADTTGTASTGTASARTASTGSVSAEAASTDTAAADTASDEAASTDTAYTEAAFALVDHALTFGFDQDRGGLAAHGHYDQHADGSTGLGPDSRYRLWWTQAELLNALTGLAARSGDERYLTTLLTQWGWIREVQMDRDYGDWYQEIDPESETPLSTDKGGEWKTAYHTSRALIRTVQAVNALLHGTPAS